MFVEQAGNAGHLPRAFGFCEVCGRLHADALSAAPADRLGPIGAAWRSVVAQAGSGAGAGAAFEAGEAAACGLRSLRTIPVVSHGTVTEVIALHL